MKLSPVVISSRIRLARNLRNLPFPSKLTDFEVANSISKALFEVFGEDFEFRKLKNLSKNQCLMFLENHTISKELIDNKDISSYAISSDETITIMINEEDHIREQCILNGLCLEECYNKLNEIDEKLLESIDVAFSKSLGFLTSCPTNVGTGMRASVMLFLPALTIGGAISDIINEMQQRGLTIRGLYGEGSVAEGYFYQVSNSCTLGYTENEIIELVKSNVEKIVSLEENAQNTIIKINESVILDMTLRAYGILTNCYMLSLNECQTLLSKLRFGVLTGLVRMQNKVLIDKLYSQIQPAHIMSYYELDMSPKEVDVFRARFVRECLKDKLIKGV